eukprot:gnl/MRDRNA2_/MRDRNA2_79964_c0_seq1.p1 gnl/MRDRNA2_/MRDRNA2_79964_c0~~gnl/MRDRNA2_/MRDRNA2_79964_c0_seq1.p1  ORF type:complete len:296 (+),score=56.89 gnl/MRDRNA2_/MRDRNA2_79964_c0_seq1:103-888(+)
MAAAIQAAIHAKAPRRTVAAVAAAVAGAFAHSPPARATKPAGAKSAHGVQGESSQVSGASPEELLEQLRETRRLQRKAKKARRKAAKAARCLVSEPGKDNETASGVDDVPNISSNAEALDNEAGGQQLVASCGGNLELTGTSRSLEKDGTAAISPPKKVLRESKAEEGAKIPMELSPENLQKHNERLQSDAPKASLEGRFDEVSLKGSQLSDTSHGTRESAFEAKQVEEKHRDASRSPLRTGAALAGNRGKAQGRGKHKNK